MTVEEEKYMLDMAHAAMNNAYAPYSGFKVGACLKAASGKYYTGANIENASYPVTCCAERAALVHAAAQGERNFEAIAIVAGGGDVTPCGMCLQALSEFCESDMIVINETTRFTLGELLPQAFSLKGR